MERAGRERSESVQLTPNEIRYFASRVHDIDGLVMQRTRDALVSALDDFADLLQDYRASLPAPAYHTPAVPEITATTEQKGN